MDTKINLSDISSLLATKLAIEPNKSEFITKTLFETIIEGLEEDGFVKINGLGTFKLIKVDSRDSINVNTQERIEIEEHQKITFLPANSLKDRINAPFSIFQPVEIHNETTTAEEEKEEIVHSQTNNNIPQEKENTGEAVEEQVRENEEKIKQTDSKKDKAKKSPLPYVYILILFTLISLSLYLYNSGIGKTLYLHIVNTIVNKTTPTNISVAEENNEIQQQIPQLIETTTQQEPQTQDTIQLEEQEVPLSDDNKAEGVNIKNDIYSFTLVDELAVRDISTISVRDTLLYQMTEILTSHKVSADETLIRISSIHYGDKRLWPYIVKFNKLHNPNGLAREMILNIPILTPR